MIVLLNSLIDAVNFNQIRKISKKNAHTCKLVLVVRPYVTYGHVIKCAVHLKRLHPVTGYATFGAKAFSAIKKNREKSRSIDSLFWNKAQLF